MLPSRTLPKACRAAPSSRSRTLRIFRRRVPDIHRRGACRFTGIKHSRWGSIWTVQDVVAIGWSNGAFDDGYDSWYGVWKTTEEVTQWQQTYVRGSRFQQLMGQVRKQVYGQVLERVIDRGIVFFSLNVFNREYSKDFKPSFFFFGQVGRVFFWQTIFYHYKK